MVRAYKRKRNPRGRMLRAVDLRAQGKSLREIAKELDCSYQTIARDLFFSRRSAAGWPDLALCGNRGFLLRELKTEAGRLTKDQQAWGERLIKAGRLVGRVAAGRSSQRPDTARA